MSKLRSQQTKSVQRPSLMVHLKIIDKQGFPVDEQTAWLALNKAFDAHPYLRVETALVCPDQDGVECVKE